MKKNLIFLFIGVFCILTSGIYAQSQDEMKAWMDYMTPGNVHDMLAKSDGEWTGDVTMWMSPDAPPQKSTSTTVNKMILGGRYQLSNHTGNMMGMPFEGMSITAYDNKRQVFLNTWIDNMGTGILYTEGKWDEASKSINFTGKQVNPVNGEDMNVREVFQIIDDNTQKFEMYATEKGTEMKMMEITYKRK